MSLWHCPGGCFEAPLNAVQVGGVVQVVVHGAVVGDFEVLFLGWSSLLAWNRGIEALLCRCLLRWIAQASKASVCTYVGRRDSGDLHFRCNALQVDEASLFCIARTKISHYYALNDYIWAKRCIYMKKWYFAPLKAIFVFLRPLKV